MELYRQYEFKLKEIESLDKEQSRIRLGISSFENKKNENSMVKSELALLEEGDIVYKLIGPILVKQDIGEAKLQVDSRLEMIQKEINKLERNYRENTNKIEEKRKATYEIQNKLLQLSKQIQQNKAQEENK
jgi:prefoldin beta subunit